jgi:hypothetical protein
MPPLLTILLTVALIGAITWVIINYVPMPEPFKRLLIAVVLIGVLIWIGRILGLF